MKLNFPARKANCPKLIRPFLIVLALILTPGQCWSTNYFLRVNETFVSPGVTTADNFFFNIVPGRSYCLETLYPVGSNYVIINSLFTTNVNLEIQFYDRGEATPPVYPIYFPNFSAEARKCFFATGNIANISNFQVQAVLSFASVNFAEGVVIQMYETTLRGGFNTSVTDFNFLELTNSLLANGTRDSGVITGTITVKNTITDQIALVESFSINPSDRIDINLHGVVGPDAFGTVTVVHNGPRGALKGVVSQYRIVTPSPLDFEPVLQQPLLGVTGLP